jgi:hypothetical protein
MRAIFSVVVAVVVAAFVFSWSYSVTRAFDRHAKALDAMLELSK